ncbi:hypothetical protein U1Q18_032685 [Sarracenia purpurea var. burkii]
MKTSLQPVAGGDKSMPRQGNEQYRVQGPVRVQPMLRHLPFGHAPGVQLADVVGYSAPPLSPAARASLLVNAIDGSGISADRRCGTGTQGRGAEESRHRGSRSIGAEMRNGVGIGHWIFLIPTSFGGTNGGGAEAYSGVFVAGAKKIDQRRNWFFFRKSQTVIEPPCALLEGSGVDNF